MKAPGLALKLKSSEVGGTASTQLHLLDGAAFSDVGVLSTFRLFPSSSGLNTCEGLLIAGYLAKMQEVTHAKRGSRIPQSNLSKGFQLQILNGTSALSWFEVIVTKDSVVCQVCLACGSQSHLCSNQSNFVENQGVFVGVPVLAWAKSGMPSK